MQQAALQEELFIKFAEFEERCKEHDRARAIYRYALDHIPKNQADTVYQRFVSFEKQYGDREGIEVRSQPLYCKLYALCSTLLGPVLPVISLLLLPHAWHRCLALSGLPESNGLLCRM